MVVDQTNISSNIWTKCIFNSMVINVYNVDRELCRVNPTSLKRLLLFCHGIFLEMKDSRHVFASTYKHNDTKCATSAEVNRPNDNRNSHLPDTSLSANSDGITLAQLHYVFDLIGES